MKGMLLLVAAALLLFAYGPKGVDPAFAEKYKRLMNSHYDAKRLDEVPRAPGTASALSSDILSEATHGISDRFVDSDELTAINKKLKEKHLTLFYFFSSSIPPASWNRFFAQAGEVRDSFDYYGVLRGFGPEVRGALNKDLNRTMLSEGKQYRIKVHPIMFRELNITRVPVFVLAECEGMQFASRKCEYLYRMDGDVSLAKFFMQLSEKEKRFAKYYHRILGD